MTSFSISKHQVEPDPVDYDVREMFPYNLTVKFNNDTFHFHYCRGTKTVLRPLKPDENIGELIAIIEIMTHTLNYSVILTSSDIDIVEVKKTLSKIGHVGLLHIIVSQDIEYITGALNKFYDEDVIDVEDDEQQQIYTDYHKLRMKFYQTYYSLMTSINHTQNLPTA